MNILVTGGAGFIGSALAKRLSAAGHRIVIVDNFNDYYSVKLKRDRVAHLVPHIPIYMLDITDEAAVHALFAAEKFDIVCHLAAQAGVRYSIDNPSAYIDANLRGTQVLLEAMRKYSVGRMVFASSSSVYGNDTVAPFREDAPADRQVSVYGASKRGGELLAYTYAHLYKMDITCLRFFTVYGPWGRPDMAPIKFAKSILEGSPIDVYNNGDLRRDFTYIDDIVEGFVRAVERPLGYEIINLGHGSPVPLLRFIEVLEGALGMKAEKRMLPMQEGDVFETYADTTKARTLLQFAPHVSVEEGVDAFIAWYRTYAGIIDK
jgi:UDP-glucuronate 4-epimerase